MTKLTRHCEERSDAAIHVFSPFVTQKTTFISTPLAIAHSSSLRGAQRRGNPCLLPLCYTKNNIYKHTNSHSPFCGYNPPMAVNVICINVTAVTFLTQRNPDTASTA